MENTDKPKIKIPLFPKIKTNFKAPNFSTGKLLYDDSSESSDSNILEYSSDFDETEDYNNILFSPQNNAKDHLSKIHIMNNIKTLATDLSKSGKNIIPSKSLDEFSEIEEYLAKSPYNSKNKNEINQKKEKSKEKKSKSKSKGKTEIFKSKSKGKIVKLKDKKDIKKDKDNKKIINDFFINKEGDIESNQITINNIDSKQKTIIKNKSSKIIKCIGPLMEEDINTGAFLINNKKSIFSSVKDLWKFQKILLENHIIDMQSKKPIFIFFIYSVKRNLFIII